MTNSTLEPFEYAVPQRSRGRSDWKWWCVAALGLLTFVLLFQPWLSASGPFGDVHTNAFGRMDGSLPEVDTIGYKPADYVSISNGWGMLAGAAAVVTVVAAMLYLMLRIEAVSLLAAAAGVATAVFVLATLLYLHDKAPELRDMTRHRDELAGLGHILQRIFGDSEGSNPEATQQVATAALTTPALICGVAAVGTAVVALAGLRNQIHIVLVDIARGAPLWRSHPASGGSSRLAATGADLGRK
ncbi:hypothetical protein AB4305_05385 [Nocardia sp. 2YAB30]|uniref:hypothetical protein n=1 Tax=unclassified Nocardia TaxID=2637762 RepID=UPI003F98B35F